MATMAMGPTTTRSPRPLLISWSLITDESCIHIPGVRDRLWWWKRRARKGERASKSAE
jgi:hypothetical protein